MNRRPVDRPDGDFIAVAVREITAAHTRFHTITGCEAMRQPTDSLQARHQRLLGAALLWLLAGAVLLLTTLVPVHSEQWGWTPAFWLVAAPLSVLLVLEPSLPRQLLALARARRRPARSAVWN
jgi:hypothetical protein